ncbi:MAG: TIGR00282 family metallophosphoesterase [Planctomycetes bacterium]|nr:TIGR00282 family metallophosphoesterase [Planctomycetota bacterium]
MEIQVLVVGDVVGKPGRQVLKDHLPGLIEDRGIDFVVVNGENAAQGSGITESLYRELIRAGADVVTLGDHTWRRKEVLPLLQRESRILRPLNFPPAAIGRGSAVYQCRKGVKVGVAVVLGRIFMEPVDCPFRATEAAIQQIKAETPICLIEVHAEATSEKMALGWKVAGRVSCVFGTHTHVPTADERVLPGGTAFITDLGMTGPYDSIIGRNKHNVIYKFETSMHAPFDVATDDVHLAGALVRIDAQSGRAVAIERVWVPEGRYPERAGNGA